MFANIQRKIVFLIFLKSSKMLFLKLFKLFFYFFKDIIADAIFFFNVNNEYKIVLINLCFSYLKFTTKLTVIQEDSAACLILFFTTRII